MTSKLQPLAAACATLAFLLFMFGPSAQAQTFTKLYDFTGGSDGGTPLAGMIQDEVGNLYGTTVYGGNTSCEGGCGVVFELNTAGSETPLYSFLGGRSDGDAPEATLLRDRDGNLYGTAAGGGRGCGRSGCGVVFKLDTAGKETILYNFRGGATDGCYPVQGLVMDKSGNLYGTTLECGAADAGTVFKLTRAGRETILHSFTGPPTDGQYPSNGHLLMDKAGNLYGVTSRGGPGCPHHDGCGVLYELAAGGQLTVLHAFGSGGADGCEPYGSVATDRAGNLYGTTWKCGSSTYGTVWRVGKKGKETILHNFAGGSADGANPYAGVVLDPNGNIYGVTLNGGAYGSYYGTLWELSAKGTFTLLHSFGSGDDGQSPYGELLRTANGELYGTTSGGGSYYLGTVWSYAP